MRVCVFARARKCSCTCLCAPCVSLCVYFGRRFFCQHILFKKLLSKTSDLKMIIDRIKPVIIYFVPASTSSTMTNEGRKYI